MILWHNKAHYDSLCSLVKDLFISEHKKQALRVHSDTKPVSHNLIFCDYNCIVTPQWSLTAPDSLI